MNKLDFDIPKHNALINVRKFAIEQAVKSFDGLTTDSKQDKIMTLAEKIEVFILSAPD